MTMDTFTILKDIGKQFGRRVANINLFDTNVCTSPRNPIRPWEHLALPGDIFRHKLSIIFGGHRVTLLANGDFIVVQVLKELNVDVCSINRRDKVFALRQNHLCVTSFPSLPVYSREPDTDLRQLLNSEALAQAINALRLTECESLHFYRNGLHVYLQRESKDGVMSAVEVACKLTEQLPTAADDSLNLAEIPAKFESLLGLIPKWEVSDDERRSEILEEASRETLQVFVASVSPYIPAIDEYLASFGDQSPPDVACALGALAEGCLEAQILLRDTRE
jgi:hypothetical protein